MRAKKKFVVVAYDISDDKRRGYLVKELEKVGVRVNYSVFECMLTDIQYERMRKIILSKIDEKEDVVVYYPLCVDCYSKIVYQRKIWAKHEKISVI